VSLHIGVISLFPEMLDALRCGGITARALEKGLFKLSTWNPRDFTQNKNRRLDDRPYGGGPGMVMQVQPLRATIKAALSTMGSSTRVIYLSPQGRRLDQDGVRTLLNNKKILFISGRYEGIDERIIEQDIDEQWSIGEYVLSGGELPAMVIIDAMIRQLPGALGHKDSATEDSFYNGLLDYPHYTRPEEIDGQKVPSVLLSGNHSEIARWRKKQALGKTWINYPALLEKIDLNLEQQTLLNEFIKQQEIKAK